MITHYVQIVIHLNKIDYARRHKSQIDQGKQNFLTLVDMFSKIE